MSETHYDEVPYIALPFSYTRPERLSAIGSFFGMKPPKMDSARILNLGCSSGGDMLVFAESYPDSRSVGVDLSKVQVDEGLQVIEKLGIKNIELRCTSIMDVDKSFGKFDYIICHGVFSWVPEDVRAKILEICKNNLNPQGIAFISYNTLPGWNMVRTVKEMMQFHASLFSSTSEQITQSKLFLDFVAEGLEGSKAPYEQILKGELEHIKSQQDSYVLHEYLRGENVQFYFRDFMQLASACELQYLGDSSLHSMYVGNLPAKAQDALSKVGDIVRTEQYMDFINNRRFRCTLLCHDNVHINRAVNMSTTDTEFYFAMHLSANKPISEVNLDNNAESITFEDGKGRSLSAGSAISKAVLYSFVESQGMHMNVNDIAKYVLAKLPTVSREAIMQEVLSTLPHLVLSGMCDVLDAKPKYLTRMPTKPKVSNFVKYQADIGSVWAANQMNETFQISLFDRFLLKYLDGKNSISAIVDKLVTHVLSGELVVNQGSGALTKEEDIKNAISIAVKDSLEGYLRQRMLIG